MAQVPKGHVWLQGDNLHNSTDSRHYGAVPAGLLRGRVALKVPRPLSAIPRKGAKLRCYGMHAVAQQHRQAQRGRSCVRAASCGRTARNPLG